MGSFWMEWMSAPSERKCPQSAAVHYSEDCQGACDCGVDGVRNQKRSRAPHPGGGSQAGARFCTAKGSLPWTPASGGGFWPGIAIRTHLQVPLCSVRNALARRALAFFPAKCLGKNRRSKLFLTKEPVRAGRGQPDLMKPLARGSIFVVLVSVHRRSNLPGS